MKTLITEHGILDAGVYDDICLHPELPLITLTVADVLHEGILQVPLVFSNRFSAREAMARILSVEDGPVDLSDLSTDWPAAAAELVGTYARRFKAEHETYESETASVKGGLS